MSQEHYCHTTNHATCCVCGGLENLTYFAALDRWYCPECWPASEAYRIDHGPQKSPSSVRAVEAQVRQTRRELTTEGE